MGGLVKPLIAVGGESLFAGTVRALTAAGAAPIVAVGTQFESDADIVWAREDPPLGGPVPAIAAGLARLDADWTYVLAGDLVHPGAIVERLRAALLAAQLSGADADGWAFMADGHPQWLAGLYRTASVRHALAGLETERNASMRALLGALAIEWIVDDDGVTADIDSPADLARAIADLEESS